MVKLLIFDKLLEWRILTDEDQSTNEPLSPHERLPKWSAPCYGEVTQRLKNIQDEKLFHDWSELIVAIHCAAWSAFAVKDRHNSAKCLPRLRQLPWLWWPQSTSIMDNRGGNRQIKRQQSLDTLQVKAIGGAGTNGDCGRKYTNTRQR